MSESFQNIFASRVAEKLPGSVEIVPCGWLRLMPTLFHGRSDLLSDSLLALYTGFVGRENQDSQLMCLSLQLYCDALQSLRGNLMLSHQKCFSGADWLLASIIILSRCELLASDKPSDGHMAHARAGLGLLQRVAFRLPDTEFSRLLVRKYRCIGVSTLRN